jgi:hypothetical protein
MAWLDWESEDWVEKADEDVRQGVLAWLESLRQEHGKPFACLLEALSHADPQWLMDYPVPPSEYVSETLRILEKLPGIESPETLQKVMYDTFVEGRLSDYEAPAREF